MLRKVFHHYQMILKNVSLQNKEQQEELREIKIIKKQKKKIFPKKENKN